MDIPTNTQTLWKGNKVTDKMRKNTKKCKSFILTFRMCLNYYLKPSGGTKKGYIHSTHKCIGTKLPTPMPKR